MSGTAIPSDGEGGGQGGSKATANVLNPIDSSNVAAEVVQPFEIEAGADAPSDPSDGALVAAMVDLESALAALRSGTGSEAGAAGAVRNLHSLLQLQLPPSQHPMADGGAIGSMEMAVRAIFGRLAEAPANWHQAVVFALAAPDDEPLARQAKALFAIGWCIVLVQTFTVVGMLSGTAQPACASSDQCEAGRFCSIGNRDRCGYCGDNAPMPMQIDFRTGAAYNVIGCQGAGDKATQGIGFCGPNGKYNDVPGVFYAGFNLTGVADMCRDPSAYLVNVVGNDGTVRLEGVVGDGSTMLFAETAALEWCKACVTFGSSADHVLAADDLGQWDVIALSVDSMGIFE